MPIICRLLQLTPEQAARLTNNNGELQSLIAECKTYGDVYRYWHTIEYLLARHSPGTAAAGWLSLGQTVSNADGEIPAARLIPPQDVERLNEVLKNIEPDALYAHYDAARMDEAGVYPRCWERWEETFDPAGQVLEHYHFLREFAGQRAGNGEAMLLYFEFLDDGSDDLDDEED